MTVSVPLTVSVAMVTLVPSRKVGRTDPSTKLPKVCRTAKKLEWCLMNKACHIHFQNTTRNSLQACMMCADRYMHKGAVETTACNRDAAIFTKCEDKMEVGSCTAV